MTDLLESIKDLAGLEPAEIAELAKGREADYSINRYIPINAVGNILPGRNGRLSRCSLWRWVTKGVNGAGGRHAKLETIRVGGRRYTTVAAVLEFVCKLDGRAYADQVAACIAKKSSKDSETQTAPRRMKIQSHKRAMEYLRREGLISEPEPPPADSPAMPEPGGA